MRVYFAGPLFTLAEREWNKRIAEGLRALGHTVFLPQEEEPRQLTGSAIFEMDVSGILDSDVVVAIMDGSDPDSGTCWEVGFAAGKAIPVLNVRTDFRGGGEGDFGRQYNLMPAEAAWEVIYRPSLKFGSEDVIMAIHLWLERVEKAK
jgi:nucleoside 2-deoxyribosyltransferase